MSTVEKTRREHEAHMRRIEKLIARDRGKAARASVRATAPTHTYVDAVARFEDEVQRLVDAGMRRTAAHAKVCKQLPELRKAMVEQYNAERR